MRSSSSSAGEHGLAALLRRAFDALRVEHAPAFARMCLALMGRTVEVHLGAERVLLRFETAGVVEERGVGTCDVSVAADRALVIDFVDGRTSLLDALLEDRLDVRGGYEDVLALHEGFVAFMHGAVRGPSFPTMAEQFRETESVPPVDEVTDYEICAKENRGS